MTKHKKISLIKSYIRIFGLLVLVFNIALGSLSLIIAEILGIIEEKYENE